MKALEAKQEWMARGKKIHHVPRDLEHFFFLFFFFEYTASKCDCQVAASHGGSSKNRARRAQINQWPIQRMGQMISELVASFAERREPSLADFDYLS